MRMSLSSAQVNRQAPVQASKLLSSIIFTEDDKNEDEEGDDEEAELFSEI